MNDGSTRHKLHGGPYHGIKVRTWGLDDIPFPGGHRPPALYRWGTATTGRGKNQKTIETFVWVDTERSADELPTAA